jgi:hypothetical protein
MRKSLALASLVAFAVLAGSAGARTQVSSGDRCTYSANGGATTVNIVTAGGVQQFGFAFGVPGVTLTNIGVSGQNGTFTTGKLPANTTGAWISDTQLTGNVAATLTGSGSITGPVVVVPSGASQSSYFDAVTCAAATSTNTGGSTAKALSFTVASRAAYSAAARGWHLVVTIPTAATVSAKQPVAVSVNKRYPNSLVQVKRQSLASRGKVTLLLRATPQGERVLASRGILPVRLTVTVDSKDGREAHKTISLSLRR